MTERIELENKDWTEREAIRQGAEIETLKKAIQDLRLQMHNLISGVAILDIAIEELKRAPRAHWRPENV